MSENVIVGLTTTLEWSSVWMKCIARAWQDPVFKAALLREPEQTLYSYFQFAVPPTLKVQVVELSADHQQQTGFGWKGNMSGQSGWLMPPNQLQMVLPPAPQDPALQAVALSDYSDTGRTYPFTTL
jgi:ribosomally synthesized peptide (two-chain TOMM family)